MATGTRTGMVGRRSGGEIGCASSRSGILLSTRTRNTRNIIDVCAPRVCRVIGRRKLTCERPGNIARIKKPDEMGRKRASERVNERAVGGGENKNRRVRLRAFRSFFPSRSIPGRPVAVFCFRPSSRITFARFCTRNHVDHSAVVAGSLLAHPEHSSEIRKIRFNCTTRFSFMFLIVFHASHIRSYHNYFAVFVYPSS